MAIPKTRRCIGSTRFGIEPHEAPVKAFPKQPSQSDGLGRMCAEHWKAYVKGLAADRKARATGSEPTTEPGARPAKSLEEPAPATTKPERRRTPMASKRAPTESPRIRKARETLAATETLPGPEFVKAVGTPDVQAALEVMNGHGTVEPDDGQVLVAGVLYDAETLEEAEPVIETTEADAA